MSPAPELTGPAALDRVIEMSGCYPAFIQACGKEVWNMAPSSPITIADVCGRRAARDGQTRRRVFPRARREGNARRAPIHGGNG